MAIPIIRQNPTAPQMTAEKLIAEVRQHRTPGHRPQMDQARIRETLTMLMDGLLCEINYHDNPASAPAFFARCLAAIVADIEDMHGKGRLQ